MSEIILSTDKSWDGLAEAFANEIAKQYKSHLEHWHATAMDDRKEQTMWKEKIRVEPDEVKKKVFNRIKAIMSNQPYYRKYFLKKFKIFVDWSVIRITPATGFYKNMLESGDDITHAFPVNVEYRIDMTEMKVIKIVNSQPVK